MEGLSLHKQKPKAEKKNIWNRTKISFSKRAKRMKTKEDVLKATLFLVLERGIAKTWKQIFLKYFLLGVVLMSVISVAVETMQFDNTEEELKKLKITMTIEVISTWVFTIEYLVRLWVCTEDPHLKSRAHYIVSFFSIIDLLAVIPTYYAILSSDIQVWTNPEAAVDAKEDVLLVAESSTALRFFRFFRLLKFARFSRGFMMLAKIAYTKSDELMLALLLDVVLLIFVSALIHAVERGARDDQGNLSKFKSIPASMWWATAALTTVGYGDMVPVTTMGRGLGAVVAILAIGLFSLPAGILSSGFSDLSRETKEKSKYFYRLMSRSLSRMSPACRAFNKWKLVTQERQQADRDSARRGSLASLESMEEYVSDFVVDRITTDSPQLVHRAPAISSKDILFQRNTREITALYSQEGGFEEKKELNDLRTLHFESEVRLQRLEAGEVMEQEEQKQIELVPSILHTLDKNSDEISKEHCISQDLENEEHIQPIEEKEKNQRNKRENTQDISEIFLHCCPTCGASPPGPILIAAAKQTQKLVKSKTGQNVAILPIPIPFMDSLNSGAVHKKRSIYLAQEHNKYSEDEDYLIPITIDTFDKNKPRSTGKRSQLAQSLVVGNSPRNNSRSQD